MTTPSEPTPTTSELSNPSSITPSVQDPDLADDFSISSDREFISITVALPDGGTTDPLPIKVDDLILENLGTTRRYKLDWQKVFLLVLLIPFAIIWTRMISIPIMPTSKAFKLYFTTLNMTLIFSSTN
jgi:hypothetical protein